LGVSDRHYFAWLTGALARFERESGELHAIAGSGSADLMVLAGARQNPAIAFVREALGGDRASVRWLDRFERGPDVERVDFNALDAMHDAVCDVLMMTRASNMIMEPTTFLRHTRRMLRPGGLMIIDWLHGAADAPRLDLHGHHEYEGRSHSFFTTYADEESINEYAPEFEALIRHVNHPPSWVDVKRPGGRVPMARRVRRLVNRTPEGTLTRAGYVHTLRERLQHTGKHLIEPEMLGAFFKVVFRDARYLYPATRKFYLHLLTVLRPVGT
jgi:hypothetical protein